MHAYLNERSFGEFGDWATYLKASLQAALELSASGTLLLKDSSFFTQPSFKQRFNNLTLPADLKALLRELAFGSRYYRCWRPDRLTDECEPYECRNPQLQMRDETICEATERRISDIETVLALLSAPAAGFENIGRVSVRKIESDTTVEIDSLNSIGAVRSWMASQRGQYDRTSAVSPKDFQTILLKAPGRFEATGKVERRFLRKIFKEIATNRLYYVDDAHFGNSAHLEVFSGSGEHLGTANIVTGDLDVAARVNGRTLKL